MSRNLMRTNCYFCQGAVALDEPPREVTRADVGRYYDTHGGYGFAGMLAAHATCVECEAKYLAWISLKACVGYSLSPGFCDDAGFFDLSFRSSFNDEPNPEDMPKYRIERVVTTTRHPWTGEE